MLDEKVTFGEQASYPLEEEVVVEDGDKIITECIFFNDTAQTVTFGESNDTEMCFNSASYYRHRRLLLRGARSRVVSVQWRRHRLWRPERFRSGEHLRRLTALDR